MESPLAQDCPALVEAQEDSSSVVQPQENAAVMVPEATTTSQNLPQTNEGTQEIENTQDNSRIAESGMPEASDNTSEGLPAPLQASEEASDQERPIKLEEMQIPSLAEDRLCPTVSTDVGTSDETSSSDFVPISADIKTIGVEISDEEVKQLKNDIRRLSPVLVSLRERTLGEISLTSDSGLFEDQASSCLENDTDAHEANSVDEIHISKSEVASLESRCALEDGVQEEKPETCKATSQKELLIVLSRVDVSSDASRTKNTSETALCNAEDTCVHEESCVTSKKHENHDLAALNISPKYLENDQLSRKSPMVVLERTEDLDQKFIDQNDIKVARKLDKEFDNQEDIVADSRVSSEALEVEARLPNDVRESVDTETETETGSDSSELVSMTSVQLADCEEAIPDGSRCREPDALACDEVTPGLLTRLEADGPEAFTEDSAESLALATGAGDEVRSDGSDSGLGSEIPGDPGLAPAPESDSETSFLDRIPDDILSDKEKVVNALDSLVPVASSSGCSPSVLLPLPSFPTPQKSSLKRRLSDCMEGEPSAKRSNTVDEPARKKRSIHFDAVTVYYFPRAQGFTCVPSQGGSTLGMSATHTHAERFSLTEHAAEQRRIHRARLAQLRSERAANCIVEAASSSEDPSDDTDEEPSDTEDLDIDSYYFLQPVPTWQRRALLRAAGVRRIDAVEKDDCRDIRASREHCGCGCKGYCDPESCPCSRANVKCQVDRAGFPCGCSRDGCANSSGRIEFNPVRVRTHFIHTLMRLELEKKQREEETAEREMSTSSSSRGPLREGVHPTNPGLEPSDPSCMNAGGFTTLHYDSHEVAASSSSCQQPLHAAREDSLDLYAIRDDCYPSEDTVDNPHNPSRKTLHPEFNQAFQAFPGQQAAFQSTTYQDYQGYETLPSTSRPQFQQQFQSVAANAAFSHYSPYQDPSTMPQATCHPAQHPPAPIYETTFAQDDNHGSQQYTNLNSVQPLSSVVQQMGKLEPFSELLAGRYSYYGEVEPQPINSYHGTSTTKIEEKDPGSQEITESTDDCDENFGEIIKKSMVETVSA